jgi:hypothetical protein
MIKSTGLHIKLSAEVKLEITSFILIPPFGNYDILGLIIAFQTLMYKRNNKVPENGLGTHILPYNLKKSKFWIEFSLTGII